MQAAKIDVAAIHHVEGAGFGHQLVEGFDIVGFAVRAVDKTRDIAVQIDQRVQFDGSLASAKLGPGKQRKTKIDGRRIEGVGRLIEIDGEGIVGIEFPGMGDEDVSEVAVDAPIAPLVGIGQGTA